MQRMYLPLNHFRKIDLSPSDLEQAIFVQIMMIGDCSHLDYGHLLGCKRSLPMFHCPSKDIMSVPLIPYRQAKRVRFRVHLQVRLNGTSGMVWPLSSVSAEMVAAPRVVIAIFESMRAPCASACVLALLRDSTSCCRVYTILVPLLCC